MYTTILRICVMALAWAVTVANAHGPDAAKHEITMLGDMPLESGAVVKNLRMSYNTPAIDEIAHNAPPPARAIAAPACLNV